MAARTLIMMRATLSATFACATKGGVEMASLMKGFAGKPPHAPLTDIGIGAYTAGVAMLGAGAAGFQESAMATASVLAIAVGLIAAVPTIITGLVDLFGILATSLTRTLGWWHLTVMASATGMFAGDVPGAVGRLLQRHGHHDRFDSQYRLLAAARRRRIPGRRTHVRLRSAGAQTAADGHVRCTHSRPRQGRRVRLSQGCLARPTPVPPCEDGTGEYSVSLVVS